MKKKLKDYEAEVYFQNQTIHVKATSKADARRKIKARLKKRDASRMISDCYIDER